MKKLSKFLLYYALIPFIASLPGFSLDLGGLSAANIIVIPAITAVIYIAFRKKLNMDLAAKVNGLVLLLLLVCFTVMMLLSSGNIESVLMANFCWFLLPFAPIMLIHLLMGQYLMLYGTALLTYGVAFAVSAVLARVRMKRLWLPAGLAVLCLIANTVLYLNRPSLKYAGHGFEYMQGFSSTDFTDYMVYSENSKLVTPDSQPSLTIEKEEDMPRMDGAEACYPLYAAFAKAVYQDIDAIESRFLEETVHPYYNGKIVSFSNSVYGFERLLFDSRSTKPSEDRVDLFFGARPSASQLQEAEELCVDLEITPIGREAFVFFVEEHNSIENLSSEQLKAIYHGDITNWSEVGGSDRKILAFQRPANSGSQTMMEYFMGDVSLKEPQTYERFSSMEGVIRQVAQYNNESGALGYSFRYFLEELNQEKGVKILSVDGVYPTLENIENGTYPLTTSVCLVTRKDDPNPYVQKMVDFALSEAGQEIVKKTGYAGVRTGEENS